MAALRVGFAGTPAFAAEALTAILSAGYAVPMVLTQPDRPSGRGLKLSPSPVKQCAVAHDIPVFQPASLKAPLARAEALSVRLDVLVVAAYGLILPPPVLSWPLHGALNIHASKLPRWRGAAPIQRALLAGDSETGVTIMQMDAGLDTGPMVDSVGVLIAPRETAGTLTVKLAAAGAAAIVAVLGRLARDGALAAIAQSAADATYAPKIGRADARLDWRLSAELLDRTVRAFDPIPGAYTRWQTETVKVWTAEPCAAPGAAPGTVVAIGPEGVDVACGTGALRLRSVQPAGGRRMVAAAFAAGRALLPGARFAVGEADAH
ncbi:MAG: methionyl-tRNA formyltransferase [Burkholderiales bacterium]|nr:methionyl-tRNA formyltransferase [Burkholderiales bacterium]